jgi:hypothetical protein
LEDAQCTMIVGRSDQEQPRVEERVRPHRSLPADSKSLQPCSNTKPICSCHIGQALTPSLLSSTLNREQGF